MLHELEMRQVFCNTMIELARANPDLVLLDADLQRTNGIIDYAAGCPDQYIDVGIAEQNMVGVAAGLAAEGKKPFVISFVPFIARRPCDQVTISVAYANLNVKMVGTTPGITAEYNGGTHMSFEDLSIMRAIPRMKIVAPCDVYELRSCLYEIVQTPGPVYLQLIRTTMPPVFDENYRFKMGKAVVLEDGAAVAILATGWMTHVAVEAGALLRNEGIAARVIHVPTVKPLDEAAIVAAARETGCVVTAENHNVMGGFGSSICELLAEEYPVPVRRIGVRDQFGEVGNIAFLQEKFGLRPVDVAAACKEVIGRKKAGQR
jgi:transketolase